MCMLTESSRSAKWVAVLLLILATTITYFPVKDSEFIDLDDLC